MPPVTTSSAAAEVDPTSLSSRSVSPRRLAAWVTLAVALTQAVWIVVMPPFRAIDEFDHAFRAAGVAAGDWAPKTAVDDARGLVTRVPGDLVDAASAQCSKLPYTGTANCHPVPGSARTDGSVEVATAAGRYNPLYYWVVGTAAAPFHGTARLYAMRSVGSLLCLLLLFFAIQALGYVVRGRWVVLGLMTVLTPTIVYSTSIGAPNGLEMVAGLAVWTSALALLTGELDRRRETGVIALLAIASCLLMFLRQLGPLWLVCILAVCLVFSGRSRIVGLWERRRSAFVSLGVSTALGACVALGWALADRGLGGAGMDPGGGVGDHLTSAFSWPLWTLQLVAAIPLSREVLPTFVYPIALIPVVVLLVASVRRGRHSERLAVIGAALATFAIPTALALVTLHSLGNIWQGRYEAPFVIGILPLCGLVLDRTRWAPREGRRILVPMVIGLGIVQAACAVTILHQEQRNPVSAGDASWHQPTVALTVLMIFAAWVCFGLALREARPTTVGPTDASSRASELPLRTG